MASLAQTAAALLCLAGKAAGTSSFPTTSISNVPAVGGPPGRPDIITRGQSIQDSVGAFAYQYYLYELLCNPALSPCAPTFGTWTLTVSPISGNPNVYVNVIPLGGSSNEATSDYNSTAVTGIDVIQISQSDPRISALCAASWNPPQGAAAYPCQLLIRVTGAPQGPPISPGAKAAQYVISASDSTSGSQLINGVPFIGVLTNPSTQNFTFAVTQSQLTAVPSVQFTMAPLVGFGGFNSPSVVVSALPGLPDPNANTSCVGNVGALSGLVQVVATPASPCWCAPPCTYYVGLYSNPAVPSFQYALTASTNQSAPTLLVDGVQTAGYGSSAVGSPVPLFQFNAYWNQNNSRVVRIVESPLRGTIQLFATLGDVNNVPTPNNFDYSATRISGQNEMVIRISDDVVAAKCAAALANSNVTCPIMISAVILTQRASFFLEARQSGVYKLTPGLPVEDYVNPLRTSYYYVTDVNYGGNFEVIMTPQSNQFVSVFVGSDSVPGTNFPTPNITSSFCKSADSFGSGGPAIVTIAPTDPCFCSNATTCNYYIGVSTGRNSSAEYTILAKYSGGFQLLELNVPTSDILPGTATADSTNAYLMFYPEATNAAGGGAPAQSVTFSVDTVPGSGYLILGANLCIQNSTFPRGNNPLPCNYATLPTSQSTFDFSSQVYSTDSNGQLQVLASSPAFQRKCIANLNTLNYNGSCIIQFYVVRVFNSANPSSLDSVYTISPYAGLRQLIDGQVVSGGTQSGNYSYFRYTVVDLTRPLTVTVAPVTGDPELLIGLGFYPNLANNTFASYTQGAEVITINWDSPFVTNIIRARNLRIPFDVNIAVYAVDGPTTYDIDATTNGIQNLQLNRAVAGAAGPQSFQYYFFQIPANFTRLNGFRLDFVATTGNTPVVLVNGPTGTVNQQTRVPFLPRCQNTICDGRSFTNVQFSNTQGTGNLNAVIVDPSDPTSRVPSFYPNGVAGLWAVGVYAQAYTEFLLTLSPLDGVLQVQDGIPVANSIRGPTPQYYSLNLLGQFDYVEVIVIVNGADRGGPAGQLMNIFASTVFTNRRPNATQLTNGVPGVFGVIATRSSQRFGLPVYSTYFNSTANQQQVPCTQAQCTMYFSVQLGTNSQNNNVSYTVTATIVRGGASYSTLLQGVPTYGILPSNSFAYYTADIVIGNASQANGVSLTLSPVRPDVNMFVNFVGTPGAGNSTFNASTATGVDYVYIPRGYIASIAQGRSRISIYVAVTTGFLNPPSSTASYYLTFKDNDDQVVQLLPGVPVQKQVRPGGSDYYYLTAFAPQDRSNGDLTFTLTSNNDGGDVGLYMAPWGFLGNQTVDQRPGPVMGSCANSTGDGSDWIIIPANSQPAPPGTPANAYAPQCACTSFPCNYLVTVFCGQVTRCSYTLRASIGDTTPNAAQEGVSQSFPVFPGQIVYYSIDARQAVANQRNITISTGPVAGRGNVYIWATNKFISGLTDPSFLPSPTATGTFFNMWSNFPLDSNSPPNPLNPGAPILPSINIGWQDSPSDASGTYNLTSNPIITVGISTFYIPNGPGSSQLTVTPRFLWFSQGGAPIQLTLGVTSPNVYLAPPPPGSASIGGRNNFIAIYGDGSTTNPLATQDWLIYAESGATGSIGSAQILLTISLTSAEPNCRYVNSGGTSSTLVCDAAWWATSGSPSQPSPGVVSLTLPAANRCSTANPASGAGCPTNITQNGVVYISVFSVGTGAPGQSQGSLVQVTASTSATTIQLSESTSDTRRSTNQNQPTYSFSTQPATAQGQLFPVAFYLTTTDTPMVISINYCPGPFSAATCDISKRQPTPSNNLQTFNVPAGQTQILTLRSGNSAYCSSFSLGSSCIYFVNVAPAGPSCDTRVSATCGSFTIMPTVQNGVDPALFNFAQVSNKITALTNQQMPFLGQLYGFGFDLNSANTLTVALDACVGYPALYACNPNPDPQGKCANNYKPSPSNYNHFAFPSQTGGRDYLYISNVVNTPTVFAQMLADPANAGATPTFNMLFSVNTGYYLHVGTDPSNPAAQTNVTTRLDGNSSDIIVTWPDAMILRTPGFAKVTNGPMRGVTYTVYVALGGFSAAGAPAITNSACGLAAWAASGRNGQVLSTNGTQVTVQGINRNQYYEINVVVSCNAACMQANLPPSAAAEMRANMRSLSYSNGRLLQASGYSTPDQTTAFVAIDFNSKSGGGGNKGTTPAVDGIVIGGAVGGAVGACCLISIVFMCLRRRRTSTPAPSSSTVKADDRAKRVAQLGLGASSPQMSAPSAVTAADAGAARGDRASFEPVAGTAGQNWK